VTDTAELLGLLAAPGTTLTMTLRAVESLEGLLQTERQLGIGISSNVSVDLLSTYLRKHALLAGMKLNVELGNHDDPIADVDRFVEHGLQAMVFLPFFDNLMPAFEQQIEHLSEDQIAAKEHNLRARCSLVFAKAKSMPFVFVAGFHRFGRALDTGGPDPVHETLDRFDRALRQEAAAFPNVRVIDTAPYTPLFHDELARRVLRRSRGFNSYFHKALVLDCDNTLWGGVVGEDLLEGIELGPHSHPGKIFWRAQHEFVALERQGVLLCLCSKNNPEDVDEVLTKHPDAVLKDRHIALRKINWADKVSNLRAIAEELNIGLDSLVFLDDSSFECEAVRAALPMVRVFQVPAALADYPRVVQEIKELFLCGGVSAESRSKTEQYRLRQAAQDSLQQFGTHDEYLASLDLRVEVRRDDAAHAARISELTLKSNQFNLTTPRLNPGEIRERMEGSDHSVYSLTVSDRFGSSGLTGVLLVRWHGEVAEVEAFLMSCRVIGRGVEFSIWPRIARDAAARGCRTLQAEYRPTRKNAQVADFYDRLGLPPAEASDGIKRYRVALESFNPPAADWIKVNYDE
jgi:FkbH-like protein